MLTPIALINGQAGDQCSIFDRGLAYGDGLFETIRVQDRKPLLLSRHLDRMARGCQRLHIPFSPELRAQLESELLGLCGRFAEADAVAKIILTRGVGGRGYRATAELEPQRVLIISSRPHFPSAYAEQGVDLCLCETRLGINPALAGVKHLNRLEQVLARNEWQDEYAEGLVRDVEGHIIEGTMSNLFVVKGGRLLTPLLTRCGVAGVVRELVLEQASHDGVQVRQDDLSVADLMEADALLLTNSLIGVWPVKRFNGRSYLSGIWHRRLEGWIRSGEGISC